MRSDQLDLGFARRLPKLRSDRLLVALGLAVAFIAGCNAPPTIDPRFESLIDRSFITGQPCAPPCWYGLEIGKSTKQEVFDTVGGLPFVVKERMRWQEGYRGEMLVWDCPYISSCGGATVKNDKLIRLSFEVAFDLDFEAAVRQLGPPEGMTFRLVAPRGMDASLVWPEKQIELRYVNYNDTSLYNHLAKGNKMPRDVKVRWIDYAIRGELSCDRFRSCVDWRGFE